MSVGGQISGSVTSSVGVTLKCVFYTWVQTPQQDHSLTDHHGNLLERTPFPVSLPLP